MENKITSGRIVNPRPDQRPTQQVDHSPIIRPLISFDRLEHNFENIKLSDKPSATFIVTNNDTKDVIISKVRASCGCTVPTYHTGPIMPGQSVEVIAKYNPNSNGDFKKTISVWLNFDDVEKNANLSIKVKDLSTVLTILTIKGVVV